jgi:hypothetical protein
MKRDDIRAAMATIGLLTAGALADVVTGTASTDSVTEVSIPAATIAREQWVSSDVSASFESSFQSAYHIAVDGHPDSGDRADTPETDNDADLGRRRWPQIIKAIQWARESARDDAPERARNIMPQLKAIFASEGVPAELAWIAEVESRFDPGAVSASGARGLFQFMPVTAERFGLKTEPADERSIPEKSARAAAQYLAVLYRRFGSWHLALAGYNAGEGCVGRLLRKYRATTFDEIAPYLPEQTQCYVPRVMATVALRENIWLSALPSPTVNPTAN